MATVIDSKQEMLDGIDVVGKSLADIFIAPWQTAQSFETHHVDIQLFGH